MSGAGLTYAEFCEDLDPSRNEWGRRGLIGRQHPDEDKARAHGLWRACFEAAGMGVVARACGLRARVSIVKNPKGFRLNADGSKETPWHVAHALTLTDKTPFESFRLAQVSGHVAEYLYDDRDATDRHVRGYLRLAFTSHPHITATSDADIEAMVNGARVMWPDLVHEARKLHVVRELTFTADEPMRADRFTQRG